MAAFSTYLETALINGTLRNAVYTPVATVYLALYTSNPTAADSGVEVSGGAYARQAITMGAPSSGVTTNSAQATFPIATALWGTIAFWGIRDASGAGNLLYFGAFTTSRLVTTDNQFVVQVGQLSITLS
jgi:hypothetical protein